MSRFNECYTSLENAKLEINELEQESNKNHEIWKESLEFLDHIPIKTLLKEWEAGYKSGRNYLIYVVALGYPIALVISIIITRNLLHIRNFAPISTAVITTSLMNCRSPFKKMREARRKKCILKKILDYTESFLEVEDLSILEIREKILERGEEINKLLEEKQEAIKEYQALLDSAQTNLANEILVEHGIDAQMTLDVKIKEKNKSLIKINVNK